MSQSQLLTELAKVRWNGNPKEYTDRFAAVAERGLGLAPDELADYYCTGLPTDLHLLITNNGQVKYQSWEQAATAATRLYEPKQSVLELRERINRAIRAAAKLRDLVGARKLKIVLGEPTRTALSVRTADIRHVPALAKGNVPDVRGKSARSAAVSDTMLGTVLRMNEAGLSRWTRAVELSPVLALRRRND